MQQSDEQTPVFFNECQLVYTMDSQSERNQQLRHVGLNKCVVECLIQDRVVAGSSITGRHCNVSLS